MGREGKRKEEQGARQCMTTRKYGSAPSVEFAIDGLNVLSVATIIVLRMFSPFPREAKKL